MILGKAKCTYAALHACAALRACAALHRFSPDLMQQAKSRMLTLIGTDKSPQEMRAGMRSPIQK
jgi:hypothetical protein